MHLENYKYLYNHKYSYFNSPAEILLAIKIAEPRFSFFHWIQENDKANDLWVNTRETILKCYDLEARK
jgi:hypothetical protein